MKANEDCERGHSRYGYILETLETCSIGFIIHLTDYRVTILDKSIDVDPMFFNFVSLRNLINILN